MKTTKENIDIFNRFVKYCSKILGLYGDVNISLISNPLSSEEKHGTGKVTAGSLDINTKTITVCVKNRAIADCLRTCAHELTHLKQLIVDKVDFPEDDDGLQSFEDEANVMSGRLVRFFGRENPEIYSDIQ